jgi:hypothetical protein
MRVQATEGPLATMRTLNTKRQAVEAIGEGHLRRQLKQMALRGCGRRFDEHGTCGKQKLVFAGEYSRLFGLFPGADLPAYSPATETEATTTTHAKMLVAILSRQGSDAITTAAISSELGVKWRECSKRLLACRDVQDAMAAFGWRYVPGRGRGGSRFLRAGREPVAACGLVGQLMAQCSGSTEGEPTTALALH